MNLLLGSHKNLYQVIQIEFWTLAEKCQQALPAVMKYILPVDLIQYISNLGMDESLDQVFSESFGHTCVSS